MRDLHTVSEFVAAAEAGEHWTDELAAEALGWRQEAFQHDCAASGMTWVRRPCKPGQTMVRFEVPRYATCRPNEPPFWLLFGEVWEALTKLSADGVNVFLSYADRPPPGWRWAVTVARQPCGEPEERLCKALGSTALIAACVALLLAKGKLKEES